MYCLQHKLQKNSQQKCRPIPKQLAFLTCPDKPNYSLYLFQVITDDILVHKILSEMKVDLCYYHWSKINLCVHICIKLPESPPKLFACTVSSMMKCATKHTKIKQAYA